MTLSTELRKFYFLCMNDKSKQNIRKSEKIEDERKINYIDKHLSSSIGLAFVC